MKKITLLMMLLLSASIVFAQGNKKGKRFKKSPLVTIEKSQVPQVVRNTQAKKFSSVKQVIWKLKTGKKNNRPFKDYIALFKKNDIRVWAHYKPNGTPIALIHYLPAGKVPVDIISKANSNYPGFKLKSAVKVELFVKNTVGYRLVLNKPAAKLILYVDETGNDAQKANAVKETLGEEEDSDESINIDQD